MQIWTSQATAAGLPLSNSILQLKGIEFAKLLNIEDQLKCTNGLIYRSSLPVIYRANSKAWMRSDIFVEWLHYLDNWFRTMDRKILLLVDNAGLHFNSKIFSENNSDLSDDDHNTEGEVAESSHSAQNQKKSKKKPIKKKPDIKLTNIELVYLPPNTTAHLQPMDAGIIHSFKSRY
ncbi:unnamed protein product [Rhizophagus irregularis]|uniref:DDE-1 domain-containing protein n=1 Tax=Rhizophagus irregularis TaxID=588596 RepID=A0A915YQ47_9GLOM|nr:unnamed protein product [Rhizophagus irregularis]